MIKQKEILIKLIKDNEITECTIIGIISDEVRMDLAKENSLKPSFEYYNYKNLKITYLNMDENLAAVLLTKNQLNEEFITNLENSFFKSIIQYMQIKLNLQEYNKYIKKIVNNEDLTFNDIIKLIGKTQTEIAEDIHVTKQYITKIKRENDSIGIKTVSTLINKYPLIPFIQWIKSIK